MRALRSNKVKIFLTVLLVYSFYIAPDYITATTNRYIDLTKAIVDDKTFNIDKYYGNTRDWSFYKGHYYTGAAPGLSLMAVPIYIALKPLFKLIPKVIYQDLEFNILNLFFSFFLAVLPGALIAVLLYDLLHEFNLKEKEKILITFISSFGTILFYYSTRFTAHITAVFMLFSAFYILFKFKNKPRKYLFFLAGICLGLAVLSEYTLAVGAVLILAYSFINFKKDKILHYLLLISGSLLIAPVYMFYHYKCFDNPFALATAYSQMVGPVSLCLPPPRIMYDLSFGTYRGLFTYMPVTLISLYGILTFFRKPDKRYLFEMIFISLFSLLIFFTIPICASKFWPIGGDFGPRYFICFIPFLMIPMVFAFKKLSYKIVFYIACFSVFINWCGVQYGDADNAFINIGLFVFRGLNSNLAEWIYKLTNVYIRKLNIITHFSPLIGFLILSGIIYMIWRKNENSISRKDIR